MHFLSVDYLLFTLLLTCPVVVVGVINLFTFRKPRMQVAADDALPFVSILVPARDEEKVIQTCVESLLKLNYPNFEVIVLDDNSSDSTYDILCRLRDRDHRLRVLAGALLPDGWCGKPYACWQLANAAKGEYILFTDADCVFLPDAILMALGAINEHHADFVSLAPDYITKSFWENLLVPQLIYIPLFFAPMPLVNSNHVSFIGGANGSFIFSKRDTYFDIDGHRAVRGELSEDVKFAQYLKRRGKALWYGDGIKAYSVRMYESLAQIWTGFTRNLFPAFSGKLEYLVPALLMFMIVFVIPFCLTCYGLASGRSWALLFAIPYVMIVLLRLAIYAHLRRGNPWYAFIDPFAWAATVVTAIGSIVKTLSTGAEWKGRTYVKGQYQSSEPFDSVGQ